MAQTKAKTRPRPGTQIERALFEVYLADNSAWDSGNVKAAMTRLKNRGWIEGGDDSDEAVYEITDEGRHALGLPTFRRRPSFGKALRDIVFSMLRPQPSSDPLSVSVRVRGGEAEDGMLLAVISGVPTNHGLSRQQHWENDLRWRAMAKFLTEHGYPCHVQEHGEAFDEGEPSQEYAEIPGVMDVIAGEE